MPLLGTLPAVTLLLVAAFAACALTDRSSGELAGVFSILGFLLALLSPAPKGREGEDAAADGEEAPRDPTPEDLDRGRCIRYTGRLCDFQAMMKRTKGHVDGGGEFDDDALFAAPPPPAECPLCCHAMPEGIWNCGEGVSSEVSHWQPCCGKKICCGCVFAVHYPELKDRATFGRSLNPVFLKPDLAAIAKAAKSNDGIKAKGGRANKKKKGKGKKKGGKGGRAQPAAKCAAPPPSCKAQPLGENAPPPSMEGPIPRAPYLESSERTVRLNLDGSLAYEATGTCPFCRSSELRGPRLLAALAKHAGNGCPEAWYAKGKAHYRGAHGLAKSLEKMRECWEKAVELDDRHMMAHYSLGKFYPRDEEEWRSFGFDEDMAGCQDIEKARHHLAKAAMLGHPEARYNLAYYEMRDGNLRRAFLHYQIAARQGYAPALKQCEGMYNQGLGEVVPEYLECKEAYASVHEEMCTEERKRTMRHRWLKKNGLAKTDPLGSFCATLFGKRHANSNIRLNGNREFRFNPNRRRYEEVPLKGGAA